MRARFGAALLGLVILACLDDPVGPSVLLIAVDGGSADTLWSGAPGEAMPRIRLRVRDAQGRVIPAASVVWEAFGKLSRLEDITTQSNAAGEASAMWVLGTDAAEEQRLRVTVQTTHHETKLVLRARAVPSVVSSLRIKSDSVAVRLGDSVAVEVDAVDPYGNVFPAPDVTVTVNDTTIVTSVGASIFGGPRRGRGTITFTSHGVAATLPVNVKQFVAAIAPVRDTLVFSSLGANVPVSYVVVDDRGREVRDTAAEFFVSDTGIAQIDGGHLRSVAPGAATLRLDLPPATTTIPLIVDQRIATLGLTRDTIRFDALQDTTTLYPIARDSLGFDVYRPAVRYLVQNERVVEMADQSTLRALMPGVTTVTIQDPATGVATSAPVVVEQVVRAIDLNPVMFDALGDTLRPVVIARDRLGSPVLSATLTYAVSDSSVVEVTANGQLHSLTPGLATLTIRDEQTGTSATTDVVVQQRISSLAVAVDTVDFDALNDTLRLMVEGRDRLNALVLDASSKTSYSSTNPVAITVDPAGLVHSVGNGAALVVAQSIDGPADTVRVTVAQQVSSVVVSQDSVLFESLNAEHSIGAAAIDRLGSTIVSALVSYVVQDTAVAHVDETGVVRALSNGVTRVTASALSVAKPVTIRVLQRAVRVVLPTDTIHLTAFGDPATITGIALDSLGSVVQGYVSDLVILDTTVLHQTDSITVLARGNGTTRIGFTVANVAAVTTAVVRQVATSLSVAIIDNQPIVTLVAGARLQVDCHAFDRNAFEIATAQPIVTSVQGSFNGNTCAQLTAVRSGLDTLTFSIDSVSKSVPVAVAIRPTASSALGEYLLVDSFPTGASPWAPTVWRNPVGQVELLTTAYYPDSSRPGWHRGNLVRYVSDDGSHFHFDGVALEKEDDPCGLNGSGVENVTIVARNDSAGWRMFYSSGSFHCYGWQVFSAVSVDGRNWTKEPGIRLSNGGVLPPAAPEPPPYPVGEGMVVDVLPSGEFRMIVSSFEHVDPPPQGIWQITEWRSLDQVNWTYVGVILTTRDMPEGARGSVYSPSIVELSRGLWRMFFTADDRPNPNSRSAVWSAVSTDKQSWTVEGKIVGDETSNLYYATVLDNQVYYVRRDVGGGNRLAAAPLQTR